MEVFRVEGIQGNSSDSNLIQIQLRIIGIESRLCADYRLELPEEYYSFEWCTILIYVRFVNKVSEKPHAH
jgi:hypothetical protein